MLTDRDMHDGDRRSSSAGSNLKLSDLNISGNQSAQWQRLAAVPDDLFEQALAEPNPSPSSIITCHKVATRGPPATGERRVLLLHEARQPRNRAVVDVVAARNIGGRLATVAPLDRLAPLMIGELRLSAELHATRLGSLSAFAGPHTYEVALELRQSAQHGQHQPSV